MQWLNAHNAHWALTRLTETLADIKSRLVEDDSMDGTLCESLLEARCGLGLCGLADLLEGVLRRRLIHQTSAAERGASACANRTQTLRRKRTLNAGEKHIIRLPPYITFECDRAAAILRETLEALEREYVLPPEPDGERAAERQVLLLQEFDNASLLSN